MQISVLIPAYNEEKTIGKVIRDFKKHLPKANIYVCDNNSKDKTEEIAKKNGAFVLKEENKGKFTAWVKKNMPGKSTCEAASSVMAKKDNYSEGVVKMANYAKNFGCSKK